MFRYSKRNCLLFLSIFRYFSLQMYGKYAGADNAHNNYLCVFLLKSFIMKTRLNLTIEEELLSKIKKYAAINNTSVSAMVEEYFIKMAKPSKRKNILDLLDKLEPSGYDAKKDLKQDYYKDQSKKYGF